MLQHKHFYASKFEGQERWLPHSPSADPTACPFCRPYSLAEAASTGVVPEACPPDLRNSVEPTENAVENRDGSNSLIRSDSAGRHHPCLRRSSSSRYPATSIKMRLKGGQKSIRVQAARA
jgi:hypothetical protein